MRFATFAINSYLRAMYRPLFTLHRWLGLFSGVFLLLIGLSGSLLVYQNSLERWLNPSLYYIESKGDRLSLDSLYSIVFRKYGANFARCSVDIPASTGEVYEFTLTKPIQNYHTRELYIVDIQPYSGAILREGYCDDPSTSFLHWVMYFH
ncbi:MAG TPA: PepSY domain-containing protein, partial [Bacteroidota bacterium]|nr:PepSY domain-containing protein [Bacteroidota bacterium]